MAAVFRVRQGDYVASGRGLWAIDFQLLEFTELLTKFHLDVAKGLTHRPICELARKLDAAFEPLLQILPYRPCFHPDQTFDEPKGSSARKGVVHLRPRLPGTRPPSISDWRIDFAVNDSCEVKACRRIVAA